MTIEKLLEMLEYANDINNIELYNSLDTLYRFTIGNPSRNCLSKEFKEYCESVSFEQFLKDFEIVRKQVIEELERLEEEW